jgi:putative nucleotidyltransferase with HDIG domain
MRVHVVADSLSKFAILRATLEEKCAVTSELLGGASNLYGDPDAVIVTADLRIVDNIGALKGSLGKLSHIPKRIFLIDQKVRLFTVQAYALGATRVLFHPITQTRLLAQLTGCNPPEVNSRVALQGSREAAAAGALGIASMFSAVLTGKPVDVADAKDAGSRIAESIAEDGLSIWLESVRSHHEGTYQHCLLVTGVAVDFGLSLGLAKADLQRLYLAAMFHDVGKAKIPLAILDKPAALDARERVLIEIHPAAGYDALKGNATISPEILDAVRHHHEYLDGSGYPDALCAAGIADIVRILTISDIFSALIEYRPYKPTMPRGQAYEIIRSMEGKLEKALVVAFKDVALSH